ncbi:OmpL47-type beta-barrel domain-containing protein, partial [Clostridium sp. 'White wine YQ']|uniref:OmpL47-type beta-barrel domain-containing protein n=1 Tax=Clostridium sp. 'White wine YQ' TaxID=3027474 RepID=UPI002365FD5E
SIANGNDITLKWTASSYATSYKVYQIINGQRVLKQTVTGTSVTFTNMPQGDYSYEVYSYSTRFGESLIGSAINFTLTWPVVSSPTLTATAFNVNNLTFSWQAVSWANEYRIYEVTNGTLQLIYKGSALTYKIYNLSEGTHVYQITAYNTRFGESALSDMLTETIIYPVMQSPVVNVNVLDKTSVQLTWSFVTYANGYNVYEIINGAPVLIAENINNLSYTLTNLLYSNHQYYVTAYSNSFGESDPSGIALAKLIVDTAPPVTSINAPTNWTNQSQLTITLSATDSDTGIAKTFYSIDGSDYIEGTSLTVQGEGVHKITYYSVDNAGNTESINTVYVNIDESAPVTTSNSPAGWSKNDVTVKLAATDSLSGVAKTFYSIDGSDYIEGTSFTVQGEGIHKITFYSVDNAGNTESINTIYVKVDRTAPVTTSNSPAGWSKDDVTINLAATDLLSGVAKTFYSIDGSDYIEGASFTIQSEGIHKITFYSVDVAGNIESINTTYVKIDKTAPTTTMNLSNEYKLGSTLQLDYIANDNLSGVVNEKVLVFAPNETTGKVITNGSSIQFDKPGVYTIIVTVTDAAGNSTTVQKQFTVYIQANIEVTSKVIKGNNGVFTVRVDMPSGYSTKGFDLNTATLNGVNALTSNNGYYNQAKLGQFKFERSDFNWTSSQMVVEFRCYINGYLIIGQTIINVQI